MHKQTKYLWETALNNSRFILGGIILLFGIYIIISLMNIFIEDSSYNFGLLRLIYMWNWTYWVVHIWLYSILMIVCGVLLLSGKRRNSTGIFLLGLLCFFIYEAVSGPSILNLLMFIICAPYFYTNYIKGIARNNNWRFVIIYFGCILINAAVIHGSNFLSYETFDMIQNYLMNNW